MDLFEIDVRHVDGGVVVALVGELDVQGTDVVRQELRRLAHRYECGQVTFDCGRLSFVDTTGIVALLDGVRAMDQVGRPRLVGPAPLTTRLLRLTGLDDCFDVVHDDDSAASDPPAQFVHRRADLNAG
jgi:anti-anti-sigma factor